MATRDFLTAMAQRGEDSSAAAVRRAIVAGEGSERIIGTGQQTNSLFEEPWWLDAVSQGAWRAAVVERGGQVVARLPYVVKRRLGITSVGMPRLTQQIGPWIRPVGGKLSARIAWEIEMVEELLSQLPSCDVVRLNLYHGGLTWLPFYWAGFSGSTNYTYQIQDLSDLESVWAGFDGSVRTDVKKASRLLEVRDDLGIDEFLRVNRMTFTRQGLEPSYDDRTVRRLDDACASRDCRRILFGVDSANRVHAAIYLVWDARAAYYLIGGADPSLRSSGAMTLLLWRAIEIAATVSKVFDFEGSMLRPVERFVRTFGTVPVPYVHVSKENWLYSSVRSASRLAARLVPGRKS